jgi:uncharacterized membrane protein YgaE (UPF0421/DUF939 family)
MWVAGDLLDHQQAFFAPIAAVIVITAGTGLRVRALFELGAGVATGVLVGELVVLGIGRGPWQVGVIVGLAAIAATLLNLQGIAFNQASVSAVLLAAVVPAVGTNPAMTRFVDTLVGGGCGLLTVLVIPRNPVRDIDREVQSVLFQLTSVLRQISAALGTQDAVLADAALREARTVQPLIDQMAATARNVSEIARLAPARWRQREHVQTYGEAVAHLANASRNARVLARKTSALLRHGELVPPGLSPAIDLLVGAYARFAEELVVGAAFQRSQNAAVRASQLATRSLPGVASINGAAIASQIRSLAADLMYASGLTRDEIDELFGEL